MDINIQDEDGYTALIHAAVQKSPLLEELLQRKDVDMNIQNKDGNTAIVYAISEKSPLSLLDKFLQRKDLDINRVNKNGYTALTFVAEDGGPLLGRLLARPEVDKKRGQFNLATLCFAVTNDRQDVFDMFIDTIKNPHSYKNTDFLWSRLNMLALRSENPYYIRQLLKHKAIRPNQLISEYFTPLQGALSFPLDSKIDVVKAILETPGVDVNQPDKQDHTPLGTAARYGNLEALELLLNMPGINVNHRDWICGVGFRHQPNGQTPLLYALNRGENDTAQRLLKFLILM